MPRHKAPTLEEVVTIYYQDCRVQGYKPATIRGYERTLHIFLRLAQQAGIVTLAQSNAKMVKRDIAHVQQRHKNAKQRFTPEQDAHVSATTVRNYVRDLKAFASLLERESYTPENVLARVRNLAAASNWR